MNNRVATRDNVLYSMLDYASQPALMLVATPFLLRALGVQQYGTWMLVNSVAATASGLGGGFGDGATKYVAMYRGRSDPLGAVRTLAAVLAVHSGFGLISACVMICLAPWLMGHVFTIPPALREVAISAVRISAILLLVRFVESVFVAAIRGCEQYRSTVIVSVLARILATVSAVALAVTSCNLVSILWATLVVATLSLAGQAWLAHSLLELGTHWRRIDLSQDIHELLSFSAFTWVKSSLGVLIAYADRLLVAGVLGTGPLAFYALCNQLTQPVPAMLAAAFNFVFPSFSAQAACGNVNTVRRLYDKANAIASTVAAVVCFIILCFAGLILRLWIGPAVAVQYHNLLRVVAIANCLLALSVVPQYAALAFGRARAMAMVNLVAGVLSLPVSYFLMRRLGVIGAGIGKILAGIVFLSIFEVARRALASRGQSRSIKGHAVEANEAVDFAR